MKSVKNLIVPAIILVALVISAIVYFAVDKFRNNQVSESSGSGMIDVVYFNPSDISNISVYNRDTGHTVTVNCFSDSEGNTSFEYQGDDKKPTESYSQSKLSSYVSLMASFSGYTKISSSGNFADYGLDNPAYKITINALNGSVTTISLGNRTPDAKYCYLNVSGSQDIYTVAAVKLDDANVTALSFLDAKALNINFYDLKTIHFDRKNDGLSLDANVIETASGVSTIEFYKPYNHGASQYFDSMINSILSLEISEYVAVTDNNLAAYGLNDPNFHFILTTKSGDTTELYFSRNISGVYYGYISGSGYYFLVNERQLNGLELKETVLIDPYVCYCYVKDITSITGTYGDKSFKFELDVPEGKSITSDGVYVTLDGRNAQISDYSGRSYCSILFESIACINIGGIETNASVNTSSGPVVSFAFLDRTYVTTVYDFYTRDSDSFYVFKDGEYTGFYVYSRELFNDGGTDTYSYGCWRAYELLNEAISGNVNGIYDLPKEV